MNNNPLIDSVRQLLTNYPFYANLLMCMDRKLTNSVPIAGVQIKHGRVILNINPVTFNALTDVQRKGILLHECCHLIYNHFGRFTPNQKTNIATDRAINEIVNRTIAGSIPDVLTIPGLGDVKPITVNNFYDYLKPGTSVKSFESSEYYLKLLDTEGNGKADEPQGTQYDDHSGHGDPAEGESQEAVKQIIKSILGKAKEKTKNMAGDIPKDVLIALDALNGGQVQWNTVLRRFVDRATDIVIDGSRKRRNRRHGLLAPGLLKDPKLKIGVAIDTSGSVQDNHLIAFLSELDRIYRTGITDIKITHGDTTPSDIIQYKPKMNVQMNGRGGTKFQPFLDKLNTEDVDVIIYFTDGDNYDTIATSTPILWVLCPGYAIPKGAKEKNCIKMNLGDR